MSKFQATARLMNSDVTRQLQGLRQHVLAVYSKYTV